MKDVETKKKLSPEQREELLRALKARFEKNMNRHKGLEWAKVKVCRPSLSLRNGVPTKVRDPVPRFSRDPVGVRVTHLKLEKIKYLFPR